MEYLKRFFQAKTLRTLTDRFFEKVHLFEKSYGFSAFVKHDLKGVLECLKVKICTHPTTPHRRDGHPYQQRITDVTDILSNDPSQT